ncbi:MAG: HAD family phosphatase [Anaerovoracaceae bacterium]
MKGIIFDFDGTLFDSMDLWEDVDLRFLAEYGKVPSQALRNKIKTMSAAESAKVFRQTFDLPLTEEEILAEFINIVNERYEKEILPKPFVLAYLEELRQAKIPLCIATATPRKPIEAALQRVGIVDYFSFILTPEEVPEGKTRPDIYLECARRFGLQPKEITVFEDALHCVKTAKAAGFTVVGVADASAQEEREEIIARGDRFIETFGEMLKEKKKGEQNEKSVDDSRL